MSEINEQQGNKKSLLDQWKIKNKKGDHVYSSIAKMPEDTVIPLSNGQKRLWSLQQLHPNNPFYNYSESYTLKGHLIAEHLIKAIQLIYEEHDILRSTYRFINGQVVQQIDSKATLNVLKHDLSSLPKSEVKGELQRMVLSDASTSFSLAKGPIMKASLIKLQETEHILQLTLHHIATDKWSMGILRNQLTKFYDSLCEGHSVVTDSLKIQYADYAYWQFNLKVDEKKIAFWEDKLSGEIPLLDIPKDYVRPFTPSFEGAFHVQKFSSPLSTAILELSKKLSITAYVLMLSVYYVLLYRYSGQKDILIGSPISNRDQKELEDLIGFFNETVVFRTKLSSSMSFAELVSEVRKNTLEAFSNKNVPFDVLVKRLNPERTLNINPFFQVMFLYHTVPRAPTFESDLELSHSTFDAGVSKFDLTLYISEDNGMLSSTFEYAADLFRPSTIERFQAYFRLLLEGVVANPERSIAEIPMMGTAELALISSQKPIEKQLFSKFTAIHDIIEEVSKNKPKSTALSFQNESLTYEELNRKSALIARNLLRKIQKGNRVVGLCLERSVDMIVGVLAILKAGCAYLPIDPEYPSKRIGFMIEDAEVNLILTQNSLISFFDQFDLGIANVDSEEMRLSTEETELPIVVSNYLAYIIYTSGSSGQPKGVPITHKNLIDSTQSRLEYYPENPSVFLLMSSLSFDSSIAGIFWTLCTGGTLIISEKRLEQDMDGLESVIYKNKVSHTLMLPTLYSLLLKQSTSKRLESLTTVMVAGEACLVSLAKEHFKLLPTVNLYNEYGPTETTVWCTVHKISKNDLNSSIPIGKSVTNARIYILGQDLNIIPFGAIGEIYVGGTGLTSGYLNRSELTDTVFITNPFTYGANEKIYKTGDLGRYRTDGCIEFLGRVDQQVKIRGHRIELDEVENSILEYGHTEKVAITIEEIGDENKIDVSATPEVEELTVLLRHYLNEDEVDELLTSIESLNRAQREHLLQKISNQ